MTPSPDGISAPRLGFHYFPDTHHYRNRDLRAWLPELQALGASWLTLVAPQDRAIPEAFFAGLHASAIQPVLHFRWSAFDIPSLEDLGVLFETYARWEIRYVALFDRPNRRRAWTTRDWTQDDLVERFLDAFLPLAEAALSAGLTPLFPPLEPGGDYWDTAFLRTALQAIARRGHQRLLSHLGIGAYAWAGNRPLDWGAGGPERWPGARPYACPPDEQDQRGLRIFDWYAAISQAILGRTLPILLLGMGSHIGDHQAHDLPPVSEKSHTERNLAIARMLGGLEASSSLEDKEAVIPSHVLAGNFWLLAAEAGSPHVDRAWYRPDGTTLPVVGALKQSLACGEVAGPAGVADYGNSPGNGEPKTIAHYLLLPSFEWGVADWHLEVIRPFVKHHRPAIGFSLAEAILATRVTVLGGEQVFPEAALQDLRASGCQVRRIDGDGTTIATQLATL